jgi:hypothetical protein
MTGRGEFKKRSPYLIQNGKGRARKRSWGKTPWLQQQWYYQQQFSNNIYYY